MSGPWEDFGGASGPWSDFAQNKPAAPVIQNQPGPPQELSFAEKYLAPILDRLGSSVQADPGTLGAVARGILNDGNARGAVLGRAAMGAADPGVALFQMGANAAGLGAPVNKGIADTEAQYQEARKEAGSTGFDPARIAGNIGATALMGAAAPAIGALDNAPLAKGIIQGAGFGALNPVEDATSAADFLRKKGKQAFEGAAAGGAANVLGRTVARVVSPNASTNADVQLLRDEGVSPTIGQTLGGWANTMEQKATSIPLLGDAIAAARRRATDQFDNAAINRAVAPIGQRVEGAGQDAVAAAGDRLSKAYEDALASVNHVNFDTPAFNQQFSQLQQMAARGLPADLARKFQNTIDDVVLNRMSPNGSMLGGFLKTSDSELGKLAARYGRGTASEQEFADAVKQLQSLMRQETAAAHPQAAAALRAADEGWANLVRVEGAAKAAKNNDGIFTPAQLNTAVAGADRSVRGRAVARGEALMQDLGSAGQNVLGNKYPDSGSAGRIGLWGLGALASGAVSPAIPLGIGAGVAGYSPPVQNMLRALFANRPDAAPQVANQLRRLSALAPYAAVPLVEESRK